MTDESFMSDDEFRLSVAESLRQMVDWHGVHRSHMLDTMNALKRDAIQHRKRAEALKTQLDDSTTAYTKMAAVVFKLAKEVAQLREAVGGKDDGAQT